MYYESPSAPSSTIMYIPPSNQTVSTSSAPAATNSPLFDPVRNTWMHPQ